MIDTDRQKCREEMWSLGNGGGREGEDRENMREKERLKRSGVLKLE